MSMMRGPARRWLGRGALATVFALGTVLPAAAQTTITMWSHEADEPAKVAWREKATKNFEAKHPGVTVKITWYDKPALNAALRTALQAGQGPDIFYAEPDQTEYITNGFAQPLDDLVNWNNIYDWARAVWTQNGKTYGLPQEAYTIELYYNKELMKKVGVTLPANGQVSQAQFLDIVKKSNAAGITPLSQGVGDRPYPGVYMSEESAPPEARTRRLREAPRRASCPTGTAGRQALTFVKSLVDAGAYRRASPP
jgi:multiple sugar transport system substrate-binding protein